MPDFRFETLDQYQEKLGTHAIRSLTVPLSLAVHTTVIGALVAFTLVGSEPLPDLASSGVRAFFVEPVGAPPPPPPPPKTAATIDRPKPVTGPATTFTARVEVPDRVQADAGSDLGVADGVPGGVEGGVSGGVAGGIVGGLPEAPPPSATVVRIGGAVREPRKLKQVDPEYPPLARAAHIEGIVILECLIDSDGRVKDVHVLRAHPVLVDAAVDAVRQWVYAPTLVNGVPSQALMTVTVRFELRAAIARAG